MLLRALKLAANGCSTHNLGLPHLVKVNVSEEEGEGGELRSPTSCPLCEKGSGNSHEELSRQKPLDVSPGSALNKHLKAPCMKTPLVARERLHAGDQSHRTSLKMQGHLAGIRLAKGWFIFGLSHFQKPNTTPSPKSQVPMLLFQVTSAVRMERKSRTRRPRLLISWTAGGIQSR